MKNRLWLDIETGELVTEAQLRREFIELQEDADSEYGEVTFEQYINNCLTINNGTLERAAF